MPDERGAAPPQPLCASAQLAERGDAVVFDVLQYRQPARAFAPDALETLVNAPWPGNVRQLLNVVEQSVALSTTEILPQTLVQQALRDDAQRLVSLDEARRAFEYDYLVRLLKTTGGNVTQAARLAQRNRTEFYKLLQRHHLTPALFKTDRT